MTETKPKTYRGRIEFWTDEAERAAKTLLAFLAVPHNTSRWPGRIVVHAVTAEQYDWMIEGMTTVAGKPGDDWNFTLD